MKPGRLGAAGFEGTSTGDFKTKRKDRLSGRGFQPVLPEWDYAVLSQLIALLMGLIGFILQIFLRIPIALQRRFL